MQYYNSEPQDLRFPKRLWSPADRVALETVQPSDARKGVCMNAPLSNGLFSLPRLSDKHGRCVTYLRLSITDRCNLRCRYCMPENGVQFLPHDRILSYEELARISNIFIGLGVNKIRITGGEPLVRKDCLEFMEQLRLQHPKLDLRITTNGTELLQHLHRLRKIDIGGINLSLDSLDKHRFAYITRRDKLATVLSGFYMAMELGIPLKLNTVVQQDTTDDELVQMASLAKDNPITVRFIELMPFSGARTSSQAQFEPLNLRLLRLFPGLTEMETNNIATAKIYIMNGYRGSLGIIEGESRKFCGSCNKVRITPTGLMKNCLYDDGVLNLRDLLREGADNIEIGNRIAAAVWNKQPDGHQAAIQRPGKCENSMATIGG